MALTRDNFTTNSTQSRNSRYVQGGITDIHPTRLGWWEKRVFEKQADDFILNVLDFEEGRPDLISQRAYGKPVYAWLVLQYNNISDPEIELVRGAEIRLPTQSKLILNIITKPEGGIIK